LYDGWSIDCWLFDDSGRALVPSRVRDGLAEQELVIEDELAVATRIAEGDLRLEQSTRLAIVGNTPMVEITVRGQAPRGGRLVVAIRPYNPEGVQFIDRLVARDDRDGWVVNERDEVQINAPADAMLVSDYASGDVYGMLAGGASEPPPHDGPRHESPAHLAGKVHCATGLATAASVYNFAGPRRELAIRVPLDKELAHMSQSGANRAVSGIGWTQACAFAARLQIQDERMQFLYDAAVRTLVLLSADEIVPGPYTYRRFWFRDACLMMNALLGVGLIDRCRRALVTFPGRQLRNGYFRSQEGEWDSNGQVLWMMERFAAVTGERLGKELLDAAARGVEWIAKKRVAAGVGALHVGLLPPGFSAEHLGTNDYYYWDDFWAVAGLQAAGRLFGSAGRAADARRAEREAVDFQAAIERSLAALPRRRALGGIPASPYRRLDSGAVGSLVADYPLQLTPPGDARIMATVEFLLRSSFHNGGFFQEIIHSGVNAYLTLDVAQTLLRARDARYRDLVETVAAIASPTGQWPEAIHPHTGGGCMGDGQHGWAAAEWAMMIRNMFVREEPDRLIIGAGLFREWLDSDAPVAFGPTPTPWGPVRVQFERDGADVLARVEGQWRDNAPRIDVTVPGFAPVEEIDAARELWLSASQSDIAAANMQG
jgi:hypothetical protein